MRRFWSRVFCVAAKLVALLSLGCSGKSEPPPPREIRWRGAETGYESTTKVQPSEAAKNCTKE